MDTSKPATATEPAASAPSSAPAPAAASSAAAPSPPAKPLPSYISPRMLASPLARNLAARKGIDLTQFTAGGSGPGGRIVAQDVLNTSTAPTTTATTSTARAAPQTPSSSYIDIPLTGMRQTIAKRLLQSKTTIPHYYLTVDIEVDEILR